MNNTFELSDAQELNLAGALLKNPERIDIVREIIKPEDIRLIKVRNIYEAVLSLREQGLDIDTVTVGDELERHNKLNEWGGRLHLQQIRSEFRGDAPDSYAWKILDYSAKRNMMEQFSTGASWANNGRDSNAIRNDMIQRLTNVRTPNSKADKHSMTAGEALSALYDNVTNGRSDFVPTGFIDLDKLFYGGLLGPDFTVIAARPGRGKTSLLLSIALHAAKVGKRVLFESLEMSNEQIMMRLVAAETGIPFGALLRGKMTTDEWDKFHEAIEWMEKLPLHLNDMPAITVNGIRQNYRKIEAVTGKPDLIIVDYLQLQGADGDYKVREQEVASVSRGLKGIAKEFDIPVLAAAQLNRAVEQRSDKRPTLGDLRESGAIEQDTDNVLFIHPSDVETKQNIAELICAKHRNGPTGTIELVWLGSLTKFENAQTRIFNTKEMEYA